MIEYGMTCSGEPSNCTPICGDNYVFPIEDCDDGNILDGDGCSSSCIVESGYTCQTGKVGSVCSAICGDSLILGSENCDDGNTVSFDGCSSSCQM